MNLPKANHRKSKGLRAEYQKLKATNCIASWWFRFPLCSWPLCLGIFVVGRKGERKGNREMKDREGDAGDCAKSAVLVLATRQTT